MIGGKVVTIDLHLVAQDLFAKAVKVNRVGDVMMIAARAVDGSLKKHFRQKNQTPNKRGFPRQNFWAQIRDSVQSFREGADAAVVQINDPRFNLHMFGGTVVPKQAKALAIPINAASYGVRAATFEDLVLLRSKRNDGKTIGVLAKVSGTGPEAAVTALYVLVKSATVPADPTALPEDRVMEDAAGAAVRLWIGRNIA